MTNLSSIESIPYELMGNVVYQLYKIDPNEFQKSVGSLNCTSKTMQTLVNNERTMSSFFLSFDNQTASEKVPEKLPENFRLRWLFYKANRDGYSQAYDEIYAVCQKIDEIILERGLFDPTYVSGFPKASIYSRTPYCSQGEKKLYWCGDTLITPFGSIRFFPFWLHNKTLCELNTIIIKSLPYPIKEFNYFQKKMLFTQDEAALMWDLLERERLELDPYSRAHGFKSANEIMDAFQNFLTLVELKPNLGSPWVNNRFFKTMNLETKEEIFIKNPLILTIIYWLEVVLQYYKEGKYDDILKLISFNGIWNPTRSPDLLITVHFKVDLDSFPDFNFSNYKESFKKIFDAIKNNWRATSSDETYHYFKKDQKNVLKREKQLLISFVKAFKLKNSVFIDWQGKKNKSDLELKIRKRDFDQVIEKLNLCLKIKIEKKESPSFNFEKNVPKEKEAKKQVSCLFG